MAIDIAKLSIPAKPALPIGTSTSAQVVWFMSKDDSSIAKYNMTVSTTGQSVDLPMTIDQVVNAEIECPENWTLIDGGTESTCVQFFDKSMRFGKAESFCNSLGATLAFPAHYDWSNLVPLASSTSSDAAFVGLVDSRSSWNFWQTLSHNLNYIPSLDTLSNSMKSRDCAKLELATSDLSRSFCDSLELPFFCQITKPKFRYCGDNYENSTEWILAGQTCLKLFYDSKVPIKSAQETCRKAGGRIAAVTSLPLLNMMASVANESLKPLPSESFFVNVVRGQSGTILSSDIFGNVHNVSVEIAGSSGDCFTVQAFDGSVSSVACNSSQFVMCERLALPEARQTTAFFSRKSSRKFVRQGVIDRPCPVGWTKFNFDCFKIFSVSKTQQEAVAECQKPEINGDLSPIRSKAELDFVSNLISTSNLTEQMLWIGVASGGIEGGWLYLDGSGSVKHIDFDLPTIADASGIALSADGTLQTNASTGELPFLCRKDPAMSYYSRQYSGNVCPEGMTLVNGSCISAIYSSPLAGHLARRDCREKFGFNIVTPISESRWRQQLRRLFTDVEWYEPNLIGLMFCFYNFV